ncbi:YlbL family protein [Actinotalea soli]|uniref:YlbL family protein n=1 Tax=Actinotalea soli TaxID=2819234 RepID=UPI0027DE0A49|nr:S16 family serine protease [Actinotalea soli]
MTHPEPPAATQPYPFPQQPDGAEPEQEPADALAPVPPVTPRAITLAAATVATSILVAVAAVIPVPYAVQSPGPTRDTLGESAGQPLITVSGTETYESSGSLLLTTVSVSGGPGYPVGLPMLVRGWLDGSRAVTPVEQVFPTTDTREDIDERNQALMISSQEHAAVAALEELGYEVPTELVVVEAMAGSGAEGVVQAEDVVQDLDGEDLASFSALSARMDEVQPGETVLLGVERSGSRHELEITTVEDETNGRALLGVIIDPEFELPVDVSIAIEDIGGPSAGSMFALGIIDMLTEEDETGGEVVAGTGTVDLTGAIGPIGGIRQKLAGAVRDEAAWFLAPEANCDEVVGHVPDDLRVVSVGTLAEARAAVLAIGTGDGEALPACTG